MVAQQIARGEDQVVKIEQGARALMVAEASQDGRTSSIKLRENPARRGLQQRGPSLAAAA